MRRLSPLRAAILATSVVAVGSALLFHLRVTSRWAQMLRTADAMQAERMARDPRRPVLGGPATTGKAWTDYQLGSHLD